MSSTCVILWCTSQSKCSQGSRLQQIVNQTVQVFDVSEQFDHNYIDMTLVLMDFNTFSLSNLFIVFLHSWDQVHLMHIHWRYTNYNYNNCATEMLFTRTITSLLTKSRKYHIHYVTMCIKLLVLFFSQNFLAQPGL